MLNACSSRVISWLLWFWWLHLRLIGLFYSWVFRLHSWLELRLWWSNSWLRFIDLTFDSWLLNFWLHFSVILTKHFLFRQFFLRLKINFTFFANIINRSCSLEKFSSKKSLNLSNSLNPLNITPQLCLFFNWFPFLFTDLWLKSSH